MPGCGMDSGPRLVLAGSYLKSVNTIVQQVTNAIGPLCFGVRVLCFKWGIQMLEVSLMLQRWDRAYLNHCTGGFRCH